MAYIENEDIRQLILQNKDNMISDIESLVKIPSVRNLSTAYDGAPFGKEIRNAFDMFTQISEREGFSVQDFDGYAMHVEYGEGEDIIGVLGHLDIVPIYNENNWNTPPFELVEKNGHLYGRGVNDDKAPMVGCLYALKLLKEKGYKFKRKVRLILGGAEETTWECMDHYFKLNNQPLMAFSPDGNFPIVNGEKGILYYTLKKEEVTKEDATHNLIEISSIDEVGFVCNYVKAKFKSSDYSELKDSISNYSNIYEEDELIVVEYKEDRALSRNPDRAYNAIYSLVKDLKKINELNTKGINLANLLDDHFVDSIHGEKMGLYIEDDEMGKSTMCPMNIRYDEHGLEINFDYRYPKGILKEYINTTISQKFNEDEFELTIIKDMNLLYVSPESELISTLGEAYLKVFDAKPDLISKGAASYARVLENGVAFGPTVEGDKPNSHDINENIRIDTLFNAIEVYYHALYNLACK